MKKTVIAILILMMIIMTFSYSIVYATNDLVSEKTNGMLEVKNKAELEIEEYKEKYNSDTYGMTAFILSKVRFYSIPVCFIGIIIGALYQYVLGTRRLDKKHKGFNLILTFVTLLVLCQILPLIFAIIVTNWRG